MARRSTGVSFPISTASFVVTDRVLLACTEPRVSRLTEHGFPIGGSSTGLSTFAYLNHLAKSCTFLLDFAQEFLLLLGRPFLFNREPFFFLLSLDKFLFDLLGQLLMVSSTGTDEPT